MTEVPQYLLQRSQARREALASAALGSGDTPEKEHVQVDPDADLGQALADSLLVDGVLECSVIASDIAVLACQRFTEHREGDDGEWYFSQDPSHEMLTKVEAHPEFHTFNRLDEDFAEQPVTVQWLGSEIVTSTGYRTRLGLVVDAHKKHRLGLIDTLGLRKKELDPTKLTLMAVMRGNLALPLVKFSRREKWCDYLQFWGEDKMSELESANFYGWGSDDVGSRFESVQAVGQLIKGEYVAIPILDILKVDQRLQETVGSTSEDVEAVLAEAFRDEPSEQTKKFQRQFHDVKAGRSTTELTVEATLDDIEDRPFQKRFALSYYFSSQADRDKEEQVFTLDKTAGITVTGEDGESTPATGQQIKTIRRLLTAPARVDAQRSNDAEVLKYGKAHYAALLGSITAIDTIIYDFSYPLETAATKASIIGAASTLVIYLLNKARGK